MAEERQTRRCALCGRLIAESAAASATGPDKPVCDTCRPWLDQPAPPEWEPERLPPAFSFTPANHLLMTLLLLSAISALVYRYIHQRNLVATYAMFVGLPLIIGALSVYMVRPRSSFGTVMKLTTVLICVVAPVLGEYLVCILMAAPILYAIAGLGYLLALGLDRLFNPPGGRGGMVCLLLIPFIAAELTSGPHGIRNGETLQVSDTLFVAAPPERAWQALSHAELVSPDVPLFLRLGFPLPTRLERLPDGETRLIFDASAAPWHGTNVIVSRRVADARRLRLTFFILEDGTRLAHWLTFMQTRFDVTPAPGGCRVRQTTTFRRRLQPGAYWRPLQRFAVGQMHAMALSRIQRLAEAPR
jgi:hypothetical protein